MKQNLQDIKTESTHNNTVLRKRLITVGQNKGKLETCNYAWLEKGKQLETHAHLDGEEFYLFLEGEGEMLVGEEWFPVKKDDFVVVEQNKNHSLKNHHNQNLVYLAIRTVFI
jgi:mannose-6-phosphate isomerase-like protein (cupin superfamily)